MDNSFLSLYNDFDKALLSGTLPITRLNYTGSIQMLPKETFLQITNLTSDIAFAGSIKVELVNTCGEIVKDITGLFFYDQFTDVNGTKQIAFEFAVFGIDTVAPFLLKITNLFSGEIWYTTPFYITSYGANKTTRIDYTHESRFEDISYDKAPYFQSCRFGMFKHDENEKTESKEYTQLKGRRVSFRNTTTFLDNYKMQFCDYFLFKRLRVLFNHDIIYINGFRSSDKPVTKKGERVGQTNFFNLDVEHNPSGEYREFEYQLFQPFRLDTKIPFGKYTLLSIPNTGRGVFNRNFTLGTGTLVLRRGSTILRTYTQADLVNVTANAFEFDLTGLITTNDIYNIQFSQGLFVSQYGEDIEINNSTDWQFQTRLADFDANDFNSNDFLT